MTDLNTYDSLVRYEICSTRPNYVGFLRGPLVSSVDRRRGSLEQLQELLEQPMPAPASRTADDPDFITPLSLRVVAGNAFYVVTITEQVAENTRARFGPGAAPMVLLPPNLGPGDHPFTQFGLYHLENGKLQHWPHDNVPTHHKDFPADAWVGFGCDHGSLKAFFAQRRSEIDQKVAVPFYFNLYDMQETRICPIWELADPPHPMDQVETHGGIHPADAATHGGIHPSNLVQYVYV